MSAGDILLLASEQRCRIATAESCTGGMIAAALSDLPGSSAFFEGGLVTYSNDAKIRLLGVAQETLDVVGAVSEAVAGEMARGALDRLDVDIALSVTGIAGPGGSEFKPEGRVCFGLATRGGQMVLETVEFGAPGREFVRQQARDHGLKMILSALEGRKQASG